MCDHDVIIKELNISINFVPTKESLKEWVVPMVLSPTLHFDCIVGYHGNQIAKQLSGVCTGWDHCVDVLKLQHVQTGTSHLCFDAVNMCSDQR